MDFIEEGKELVNNLNQRMGPSAYDIAWLARLKKIPQAYGNWDEMSEWLLENQRPDGSWGAEIVYYHDRIICTLSAVIALQEVMHTPQAVQAIRRGETYIWQHFHLLKNDPLELVGFELLLPTLLDEALAFGLDVPDHACGYREIRTAKMQLIPSDKLYSPALTLAHSIEFLGPNGDPDRMPEAQACNGSFGNSPAATAYYLLKIGGQDSRALAYLDTVRNHSAPSIYLYPFRTFEETWVLNNLGYTGLPIRQFASTEFWEKLLSRTSAEGIGFDPEFAVPDGDLTSVGLQLLINAGYNIDPLILAKYENCEKHIFRTYHYERNASVSTNAHALDTLDVMPDYPHREVMKEHITSMLFEKRAYNVYWTDKWHASPFYATSHTLMALLKDKKNLAMCQSSIDWIMHTQRKDGSWGFFKHGTAEETSYALLALFHFYRHKKFDTDILRRGVAYLMSIREEKPTAKLPEIWLGKDLYAPYDIVNSTILAALILFSEIFGQII